MKHTVWQDLREKDLANCGKSKGLRKKVWRALENSLSKHHPSLWDGEPGESISNEQLADIESDLINEVPRTIRKATDLLARGLQAGRLKYGWSVTIPEHFHLLAKETNFYTPPALEANQVFRAIENALIASLKTLSNMDSNQMVGKILLSAIISGGLHQKRWLQPWLNALEQGPKIWKDWLWLNLVAEDNDPQGKTRKRNLPSWNKQRRWIADPISHLLILYWTQYFPDGKSHLQGQDYQNILKQTLEILNIDLSLNELLASASAHSAIIQPGFLVAYQSGKLSSVSLPEESFQRFLTGEVNRPAVETEVSPPVLSKRRRSDFRGAEVADAEKSLRLINVLLSYLRNRSTGRRKTAKTTTIQYKKITKKKAHKVVVRFIERFGNQLTPAARLIAEWAKKLFEKASSDLERRMGAPLAASTVVNYISTIAPALLENTGRAEIVEFEGLTEADFEVLYEIILSYPESNRKKLLTADKLAQFHGFLQTQYDDVPEIDFDEIKSCYGLPSTNVRANIITYTEYRATLRSFGWGRKTLSRWQKLHIIAFIFAFRCGLRRGEIQGLQICDIKYRVVPELRIRPGRFRDLKSVSGNRRIPLHALLPEDELNFVIAWSKERQQETTSTASALLFHPETETELVPVSSLFDPIVSVLRTITSDDTLSIHSCRHSFATFLFLRLLWRDDIPINSLPMAMQDSTFSAEDRVKFKKQVLDNEILGTRTLHFISSVLGHADLQTTFSTYLHLVDWLQGAYARHPIALPYLDAKAWQNICKLSQAGAYKHVKKKVNSAEIFKVQLLSKSKTWGRTFQLIATGMEPYPLQPEKGISGESWLPAWGKALKIYQQECKKRGLEPKKIPVGEKDLGAQWLYGKLHKLSGRQMMFAKRIVPKLADKYNAHDGGVTAKDLQTARDFRKLVGLLNIHQSRIVLMFHPAKGQSIEGQKFTCERWRTAIDIPATSAIIDRSCGTFKPKWGQATIKLCSDKIQMQTEKTPHVASSAFRFILEFVSVILSTSIDRSRLS